MVVVVVVAEQSFAMPIAATTLTPPPPPYVVVGIRRMFAGACDGFAAPGRPHTPARCETKRRSYNATTYGWKTWYRIVLRNMPKVTEINKLPISFSYRSRRDPLVSASS